MSQGTSRLLALLGVLSLVVGCGDGASIETSGGTYDDTFAYCEAVGTIDQPDDRYVGPDITDDIIDGYLAAAGIEGSSEPRATLAETTLWRCMDGEVYACNVGANLPCESKADTSTVPTAEMGDYCTANPAAEFIPMSVTGRETIYSWHCVDGVAEVLEAIDEADDSGYLSRIWYQIAPGTVPEASEATAYCGEVGGELALEPRADVGQIGVCYFEDNRQCEEWALFRGDCPVGGLKVTGYITEAARYCAITGGTYEITRAGGSDDEQGTCTLPNGTTVEVWAYYEGSVN